MYTLYYCILELCDFFSFIFNLQGVTVKRLLYDSEDTLSFGLLNSVKTINDYRGC